MSLATACAVRSIPQRPGGIGVADGPCQVGHILDHAAAVGVVVARLLLGAIDRDRRTAHGDEFEAGRGDDDVGVEALAGRQHDAVLVEGLDLVGDDVGLADRIAV